MRAPAALVGYVRVSELLHKLELDVRLVDIGVHEEALRAERQSASDRVLAAELKLSCRVRSSRNEAHVILVHGVLRGERAQSSVELELAGLSIGEVPRATEVEAGAEGHHEVKLHAVCLLAHSQHLDAHHQALELGWLPVKEVVSRNLT